MKLTYAKAKHIEEQSIADETMLYDTKTDYVHVLNTTAREIWKLSDSEHSQEDIVKHFIENYPQEDEKSLKKEIDDAISDMLQKEIIELK